MTKATQECLITVARKLFGRFGFKGVSVRQICEAADCNQAAISYHFKGKEELYRRCISEGMEKDFENFRSILTPAKNREDMEAKLGLFLKQFYDHLVENSDVVRIVTHELTDPSPVVQDVIQSLTSEIPQMLEAFLKDGIEKGYLNSSLDPASLNNILCSQVITQILFEEKVRRLHGNDRVISNPIARKYLVDQIMLIMSGGIYVK